MHTKHYKLILQADPNLTNMQNNTKSKPTVQQEIFLFKNCSYGRTQPGHPLVGRCNKYQLKGGDALRQGSEGRYGLCVGGR